MNSFVSIVPLQASSGSEVLRRKFGLLASHDIGHTGNSLNIAQDEAVHNVAEADSLTNDLRSNIAQGNMERVESLVPRFEALVCDLKQQASLLTQAYFYLQSYSLPLVDYFGSLIFNSKKSEVITVKDYSVNDITKQFSESIRASLGIEAVIKDYTYTKPFRTDLEFVSKNISGLGEFLKSVDPNLQVIIQPGKPVVGSCPPIQIIFRGNFPWSNIVPASYSGKQEVGLELDKCRANLMNIASRIIGIPKAFTSRDLKAITIELTNLYSDQESLDDLRKLHTDLNPSL